VTSRILSRSRTGPEARHRAIGRWLPPGGPAVGFESEGYRWIVAPIFFDKMTLSQRLRYGGVIERTVWTPAVDQGRN
jgi:hypothetical protein